jgi:hypothetical protein
VYISNQQTAPLKPVVPVIHDLKIQTMYYTVEFSVCDDSLDDLGSQIIRT